MTDNFSDIIKAARQMQQSMETAQQQLNSKEEIGEAANGLIKFTMNGHHVPTQLHIDNSLQGSDLRSLEQWILTAAQEAAQKVDEISQETILNLTKGIGLPAEMSLLEEEEPV